jgi:hypothetical protein
MHAYRSVPLSSLVGHRDIERVLIKEGEAAMSVKGCYSLNGWVSWSFPHPNYDGILCDAAMIGVS